jgi:hypothetical protein
VAAGTIEIMPQRRMLRWIAWTGGITVASMLHSGCSPTATVTGW